MDEVNKIIDINMKICVKTYPCKHLVTFEDINRKIRKKEFKGTEIIKMMFCNKMNINEDIIKHLLCEKNLEDKSIYKNFNSDELEILTNILKYRPIQGCENDPNLAIRNIKKLINIDMETCYLTYPCEHNICCLDHNDQIYNISLIAPHIIKLKLNLDLKMDNEFVEHFVKQIIKNTNLLKKYFTSDDISILQNLIFLYEDSHK